MVSINVPVDADAPEREIPYMGTELTTNNFSPSSIRVLNRIYSAMLTAGTTLASGALVDSTDRVFQKLVELVAAAE